MNTAIQRHLKSGDQEDCERLSGERLSKRETLTCKSTQLCDFWAAVHADCTARQKHKADPQQGDRSMEK